jgi:CysZ protein
MNAGPEIMVALGRALRNLAAPRVWLYLFLPAALACVTWLVVAWWGLGMIVAWLFEHPPMTLLVSWGLLWLAQLLAYIGGWMIVFALTYLTATALAAILVMPWLVDWVARREYPDLDARGRDSFLAAVGNSAVAITGLAGGWLVTLPLWLVPGGGLVLPMLLLAWYNRRTFAFDALAVHAAADEWRELRRRHGQPLFLLGLVLALLVYLPFVGLLVPTVAALAYIHYGFEALRQQRAERCEKVIEGETA